MDEIDMKARPVVDHAYRGGNQLADTCNHVYPVEGDGWPGIRCAVPEQDHDLRHRERAPKGALRQGE